MALGDIAIDVGANKGYLSTPDGLVDAAKCDPKKHKIEFRPRFWTSRIISTTSSSSRDNQMRVSKFSYCRRSPSRRITHQPSFYRGEAMRTIASALVVTACFMPALAQADKDDKPNTSNALSNAPLTVVDATGKTVGRLAGFAPATGSYLMVSSINGQYITILVNSKPLDITGVRDSSQIIPVSSNSGLNFSTRDCSGTPYIHVKDFFPVPGTRLSSVVHSGGKTYLYVAAEPTLSLNNQVPLYASWGGGDFSNAIAQCNIDGNGVLLNMVAARAPITLSDLFLEPYRLK